MRTLGGWEITLCGGLACFMFGPLRALHGCVPGLGIAHTQRDRFEMNDEYIKTEIASADGALLEAFVRRLRATRALQEAQDAKDGEITANLAGDAAILRRLIEAAPEDVPVDAIARFCRAFIGECVVFQGVKQVAYTSSEEFRMVSAARGYFGYAVDLVPAVDWREALEMVTETRGMVACLPWPETPGSGQWWPALIENRFRELRILAGWPNLPGESGGQLEAALVAPQTLSPSGADDTYAIGHDDMHEAERLLVQAGLVGEVVARVRSLALIRLNGFVEEDDKRLALTQAGGLDGFRVIGALPRSTQAGSDQTEG